MTTSKSASRLRQLANDAGLYVVGFALRRALSVITMPVFTRYLSTAGYGVLAIVGSMQNMLEVFYEMGLGFPDGPSTAGRLVALASASKISPPRRSATTAGAGRSSVATSPPP